MLAENWCVKVDEKVYGPYTPDQMRKFAHEGRLASWSLIAPAGSRAWREASRESTFAEFFGFDALSNKSAAQHRTFGKRNDDEEQSPPANDSTKKPSRKKEPQAANFVVVFDVVNAAASRVEAAVLSLGNAFRLADNVWSITCELTAVGVLNAISPYLTPRESIFVVDATRGRTAWKNYAPESASKISAAYLGAPIKQAG